jgi:outer membrane protein assembly factor BamB
LPFEERQVCAVAFQGRIACFELLRGDLAWTRDVSSLSGIAVDNRFLFVADDTGAVHALDKATGASAWKQDKLMPRKPAGAQIAGDFLLVVDPQGYVYLLDRSDGKPVGRAPTDETAPTTQPARSGSNAVWQSQGGTLYAVTGGKLLRRSPRRRCSPSSSSSAARMSASRLCSTD